MGGRAFQASCTVPTLSAHRPHLAGCSPHALAGAGLKVGVVRTLRARECSATSQTSRPGLWFQNLEKLTSQMPGLGYRQLPQAEARAPAQRTSAAGALRTKTQWNTVPSPVFSWPRFPLYEV